MTQTTFWALELIEERYDGYHAWEDRSIDESYGLFLTEKDAQAFLDDNNLSREAQWRIQDEDYAKRLREWEEKNADKLDAYEKACEEGVPEGILTDPRKSYDEPRSAAVDSWYEITTISLNASYIEKEDVK